MKIRIKGNSIRLRLTRPEVDQLALTGSLEERTEFADTTFTYALEQRDNIDNLSADMMGTKMTMYIPAVLAVDWTNNNIVSFNNTIATTNGKQLMLLLEKDFKCIDSEIVEDQSDNYDNPLTMCD
ncbi:MAG: hypothetical protein P4L41_13885 [Flavipsychrobacter sp.]|nr:hypothetical protein [Flavipsychrobacter sp.]